MSEKSNRERKAVREAFVAVTGEKYCTSCRLHRKKEGGTFVAGGRGVVRWICMDCRGKRSQHMKGA